MANSLSINTFAIKRKICVDVCSAYDTSIPGHAIRMNFTIRCDCFQIIHLRVLDLRHHVPVRNTFSNATCFLNISRYLVCIGACKRLAHIIVHTVDMNVHRVIILPYVKMYYSMRTVCLSD